MTSHGMTLVHLLTSRLPRAEPSAGAPVAAAVQGLQAFGYELIRADPTLLEADNLVLSAASIGAAFAMARAGAQGETAEQIDAVLHFPKTGLGDAYNFLTAAWLSRQGKDLPELQVANAVFAQRGFDIERDFLDALARDFGAGLRTVDFTDGGAAAAINDWVKTQTRERIDKLFDQLDPETRLVLANAVYLKATWVHRFAPDMTHRSPFHRLDGTVVRPETMHTARPVRLGHAAGNGWAAVRLPYVGDELAMWVLLPSAQDADPVGLLDPAVLGSAIEAAVSRRVALSLPKWRVRSDLALVDALAQLGMTRPFLDLADFSGISPVRLKIDQVQHRADITVDEEGTEAAAVTGIAMVPVSAPPPPDAVMTVDHPFAFVVVHEPTGAPLFEGVVGDPTATQ